MDGYPRRSAPLRRNPSSSVASSSYSYMPGRATRIAAMCPATLMFTARRRRAISSASFTTRIESTIGSRLRTSAPPPENARSEVRRAAADALQQRAPPGGSRGDVDRTSHAGQLRNDVVGADGGGRGARCGLRRQRDERNREEHGK